MAAGKPHPPAPSPRGGEGEMGRNGAQQRQRPVRGRLARATRTQNSRCCRGADLTPRPPLHVVERGSQAAIKFPLCVVEKELRGEVNPQIRTPQMACERPRRAQKSPALRRALSVLPNTIQRAQIAAATWPPPRSSLSTRCPQPIGLCSPVCEIVSRLSSTTRSLRSSIKRRTMGLLCTGSTCT